jgi:hypothetical protein
LPRNTTSALSRATLVSEPIATPTFASSKAELLEATQISARLNVGLALEELGQGLAYGNARRVIHDGRSDNRAATIR